MTLRIRSSTDDEKSRRLAADVLEHHGYAVTRAASGEEALALPARARRTTSCWLDIQLPGIGGIDTAACVAPAVGPGVRCR